MQPNKIIQSCLIHLSDWLVLPRLIRREVTRLKLRRRGSFMACSWLTLALKPVWVKERVKVLVGAPLVAAIVMGTNIESLPNDNALQTWSVAQPVQNILAVEVTPPSVDEPVTFQLPVTVLTGISQFYHGGHPGIDLRAPIGTPVVSMQPGTVVAVEHEAWGYGKNVLVKHAHGLVTRYAHLKQVMVVKDQALEPEAMVGTVGTTGWATGPHLHFEIYDQGTAVNPAEYLYKALAKYQEDKVPTTKITIAEPDISSI